MTTANVGHAPVRTPSWVPADAEESEQAIWEYTTAKADEALGVRALASQLRGGAALVGQIARDYDGRFLVELIQNSYDAHPRGVAGRIHVLFDPDAGAHGVLYVANTGKPFDLRDFSAIAELAQSSKPPGQGIGNKGVGFKSVFLVSDAPEIYSASARPSAEAYQGFCFGFAREQDYLRLSRGDGVQSAVLRSRMASSSLPVPAGEQDAHVKSFAAHGFTTVNRLPLIEAARGSVAQQLDELRSSAAPILLFLDRIERLTLEVAGDQPSSMVLERRSRQLELETESLVEGIDLGTQGRYLVATRAVPLDRFRAAIEASIASRKLDPSWRDWSDEVHVSVAVRWDADGVDDRLYCFLPMSVEAHSPLHGHVNAPFAVPIARKGLIEDAPLNTLLIDVASDACAEVALAARRLPDAARLVPDLTCWVDRHVGQLQSAFKLRGRDLAKDEIVPVLGGRRWASLEDSYSWGPPALARLTADVIAGATGDPILDPDVQPERAARIEALHRSCLHGEAMNPHSETIARWVESVARTMAPKDHGPAMDGAAWLDLYDDLDRLARGGTGFDADDLRGRRILLTDDGRLLASPARGKEAGGKGPAVFFRPSADDDDELAAAEPIPASLRQSIAYMHRDLAWTVPGGPSVRVNRPGRRLLEDAGLVRRPRLREVFDQVGRRIKAARGKVAEQVYADALRFVHGLQSRDQRAMQVQIGDLGLLVPTRGGWRRAAEARFSALWPGTLGQDFERFLDEAGPDHPEIQLLRAALLRPPELWGFRLQPVGWVDFLRRAGVKEGLWPDDVLSTEMTGRGYDFGADWIARHLRMSDSERSDWAAFARPARVPSMGTGARYRLNGPVLRIPAQGDFQSLPTSARERFGSLVLDGLASWPGEVEGFTLDQVHGSARHPWPSPAWQFLRDAAWLSVRRTGERDRLDLMRPAEAWHHRDEGEVLPNYAPVVSSRTRTRVDGNEILARRLGKLGLKTWSDPTHASARLKALAACLASGVVPDSQLLFFRKAYERSWSDLIKRGGSLPWGADVPAEVVVSRRGVLGIAEARELGPELRVLGAEDRLSERVLDSQEDPVLRIDPRDGPAASRLLAELLDPGPTVVEPGAFTVLVDGLEVTPNEGAVRLVTMDREWLADLVALTLELRFTQFNRQNVKTVHEAVDRLRRIRLIAGSAIGLRLHGRDVSVPALPHGVLPIGHERWPTLVYVGTADPITWQTLRNLAPGVAELSGQPLAGSPLELAIVTLARGREGPITRPGDDEYSAALDEPLARVTELRRSFRGVLHELAYLLRPVLHHFAGDEAVRLLDTEEGDGLTEEAVTAKLTGAATPLGGHSAEAVVALAKGSDDLGTLRDALGIPFAAFNVTLRELGDPYRPLRHEEEHASAFAAHVAECREATIGTLRQAFLARYDARSDVSEYKALADEVARAAFGRLPVTDTHSPLQADPGWLEEMAVPSDDVMVAAVDRWLSSVVERPSPPNFELPRVDETRELNRHDLAAFAERAVPLVATWTAKEAAEEAPGWARGGAEDLATLFGRQGLLDFRLLTEEDILDWLIMLKAWPQGMARSLDIGELRLTEKDLRLHQEREVREQWQRERRRRTVRLDGQEVGLDEGSAVRLLQVVDAGIGEELLATPPEPEDLPSIAARQKWDRRGKRRVTPPLPPTDRLTDEQRTLYGIVGERVAYHWLVRHYAATPESWRSTNRRFAFPDDLGDDSLGYDFAIPRKRGGDLFFEVKATGGGAGHQTIEFSHGEVGFAEEHAGNDCYRILFVHDALHSASRSIHVLPNPMSNRGRGAYRVADRGIRYQFVLPGPAEGPEK